MTKQKFGGAWTVEKLGILSEYLNFYVQALKSQPFKLMYIDAFAGTGKINIGNEEEYEVIDGSAKLALNTKYDFSEYVFIEKKKAYAKELECMIDSEYPTKKDKIKIINSDCNEVLLEICDKVDWKKTRAVLFLDPYATNVKWETLQAIAETRAIDVWYLFPLNAANRLMKKSGEIDASWKNKLNSLFGDDSWESEFYHEDDQLSMFGTNIVRDADTEKIKSYIERRLGSIFGRVSNNSRVLCNSNNSPLFLFCFAVSSENPKAIGLALKVANYILKDKKPF